MIKCPVPAKYWSITKTCLATVGGPVVEEAPGDFLLSEALLLITHFEALQKTQKRKAIWRTLY